MCKHPSLLFSTGTSTKMPDSLPSTTSLGRMLLEDSLAEREEPLSTDGNEDTMPGLPLHSILHQSVQPIRPSMFGNGAGDPEQDNPLKRTFSLTQTSILPTEHADTETSNAQSIFELEDWAPMVWEEMCSESFKRQKITPSRAPDSTSSSQPDSESLKFVSKHVSKPDPDRFSKIPLTFMAPTVLASVVSPSSNSQSERSHRPGRTNDSGVSPQEFLDQIVWRRGLVPAGLTASNLRIKADDATYDAVPTPLQLASFGPELIKSIQEMDVSTLREMFRAGLSPNACNQFRDSIVDLVCKQANQVAFSVLAEHGCDFKVCDGFGRTPLHHCCWSTAFSPEIAIHILSIDPQQLFMEDYHGRTPLEYVRPNRELDWIEFLQRQCDALFPRGMPLALPERQVRKRLPHPQNALPIRLAEAVSSGTLTPEQALSKRP